MRLIDADALFAVVKGHHDLYNGATNPTDKARRDENLQVMCDITDAPDIDAIPVEWIQAQVDNEKRAPLFRRYASALLTIWQNENRRRKMGEFLDVIHQTIRICKSVNGDCGKCLVGAFSCPNNARFDNTDEQKFIDFANAVMLWATEHPEPVYPTWGQYFRRYYGLEYCKGHEMLLENIPADIAQKLGIEPKEGV